MNAPRDGAVRRDGVITDGTLNGHKGQYFQFEGFNPSQDIEKSVPQKIIKFGDRLSLVLKILKKDKNSQLDAESVNRVIKIFVSGIMKAFGGSPIVTRNHPYRQLIEEGSDNEDAIATIFETTITALDASGFTIPEEYRHINLDRGKYADLARIYYPGNNVTDTEHSLINLVVQSTMERLFDVFNAKFDHAQQEIIIEILRREVRTDTLTGISNRKSMNLRLEEEDSIRMGGVMTTGKQKLLPTSIVAIDMDHFKNVNDSYGHQVGDMVLKQLSEVLVETTQSFFVLDARENMYGIPGNHHKVQIARSGGEEFVAILRDCNEETALQFAEQLRIDVERTIFHIGTVPTEHITKTVSIGVATALPHEKLTSQQILKRADEALYIAKEQGRNQVRRFGSINHIANEAKRATSAQNGFERRRGPRSARHRIPV